MTQIIKLGVVGFGRIVELVHLPLIKHSPQFEITGVYDLTSQRAVLAEKRGFTVFSELEALLQSPIDAVLIATPQNSHFEIAKLAIRHGKHVLIEKPITVTAEEASQLKLFAEKHNKIVTVFHNRRYDTDFVFVKQIIDVGRLGPVTFVERRHHMFGSGASFGVKSFNQAWRNKKHYGGGALLDWGVHIADQLLQLGLGSCNQVDATMRTLWPQHSEVDDYVHAEITTDHNILLTMDINFSSGAPVPLWTVGGEMGSLQVLSDKSAVLYEGGRFTQGIKLEGTDLSGPGIIYSSFAEAIQFGGSPAVTIDEAVEAMRLLDHIRASAYSKGDVNGNLVLGTTL